MKKMVRCKACGFIMEEGKLGDKCPACGSPKAAFVPFLDPMSPARRQMLKLDLHPIAVHFTVSFTVAALVFSIPTAFLAGEAQALLISTTKIVTLLLPVLIIIAAAVGYVDGKVRFHKISNSQILRRKILYATLIFVVAVALAVIVWTSGLKTIVSISISALLAAIALGLVVVLSSLGTSILDSAFPGN